MVTGWRWTSWLVVSTADELNSRLPSNNPSELSERDVQLRSSNNKSNAMADRLNSLGRELCALQIGSCTGLEVYYGAVSGSLSAPLYWLLRDCRVALETGSKCAAQTTMQHWASLSCNLQISNYLLLPFNLTRCAQQEVILFLFPFCCG